MATIMPNETKQLNATIPLNPENIQEIETPTDLMLYCKIEYFNDVAWNIHEDQTYSVKVLPMDTMIWVSVRTNESAIPNHGFIATFVTPKSKEVMELLGVAKECATSEVDSRYAFYNMERSLPGYSVAGSLNPSHQLTFNDTRNITALQVKAIYNALKYHYNMSFVNVPTTFGPYSSQRISTPDESLSMGYANCIDGAVLFASAIEALGMRPYVVITPNHAYVAWDMDMAGSYVDALETTLVGSDEFEYAYDVGCRDLDSNAERVIRYETLLGSGMQYGLYESDYILVNIDWTRSVGIYPMK